MVATEEAWSGVSISVRLKLLGLGRLGQLAQATVPVRCRRAGVVRRCLREVCYVPETRSLSQVFQRNDAAFEGAPRSQGASCHSARLSRMGVGVHKMVVAAMGRGRGCLCCQHEMAPAGNGKFGWCDLDALDIVLSGVLTFKKNLKVWSLFSF